MRLRWISSFLPCALMPLFGCGKAGGPTSPQTPSVLMQRSPAEKTTVAEERTQQRIPLHEQIAQELGLTRDQRAKIRAIRDGVEESVRALRSDADALNAFLADQDARIEALLSPRQKVKAAEIRARYKGARLLRLLWGLN